MEAAGRAGTVEAKALEHMAERLRQRYDASDDVIAAEIAEALRGYDGRPVRDFVPILVEREVAERLDEQGRRRPRSATA